MEVLGLILIALAVLLSLAIVSYNPSDDPLARSFSFKSAFNPSLPAVANIMGLFGAFLSWLAVPNFLGYPVLGFPLLLLAFGWSVFRARPLRPFLKWTVLTAAAVLIAATFAGWLSTSGTATLWSGAVGASVADVMARVIGSIGTIIVLIVAAAIVVRLLFEGDLQDSIDRVGEQGPRSLVWISDRVDDLKSVFASVMMSLRSPDAEKDSKPVAKPRPRAKKDTDPHRPEFARSPDGDDDEPVRVTLNDQFKAQPQPTALSGDGGVPVSTQPEANGEAAEDGQVPDLSIHVRERVEEEKGQPGRSRQRFTGPGDTLLVSLGRIARR